MSSCWNPNESQRPSISAIINIINKITSSRSTLKCQKPKLVNKNSNIIPNSHRSYSSIGTLETSSNEDNISYNKQTSFNKSKLNILSNNTSQTFSQNNQSRISNNTVFSYQSSNNRINQKPAFTLNVVPIDNKNI